MISRLTARDFRNFTTLDVPFPANGLAIVGENGQGKTNLLEAIAYLSMLRSVRGARDSDVVRFGAPAFHVRAELAPTMDADIATEVVPDASAPMHGSVAASASGTSSTNAPAAFEASIAYEKATRRKRVSLDGVEQPRLTAALGAVPSVCFSPTDTMLVTGGPAERRHFLDVALALSSVAYLHALQQYRAALLRRNAVLRSAQRDGARGAVAHADRVSVWEPALAQHGAVVTATRRAFVTDHADRFSALAASIGEEAPVTLRYVGSSGGGAGQIAEASDEQLAEALTHALAGNRDAELRRGTTLVGPHRDELQLFIGGRELRVFGSAGQQRSAAIALRLLELAARRAALGVLPLLLLDDPFAELDPRRASRVLALLEAGGVGQTLIAVPRVEDIPPAFTRLERRTMQAGVLA